MCAMITYSQCVIADITRVRMENAIETLNEQSALLLALTGSLGTSELSRPQVDVLLNTCQRLNAQALGFLRGSSE